MRLDTVGLRVRNFPKSLKFYSKALGLRVKKRGDTRSWGGGLWALLEDPNSHRVVELNWYPKSSRFYEPYSVGTGVDHLDFTLGSASRAELEKAYRRVLRAGGRPTKYNPSTTEGWMASVQDPDGIWITIGRQPTSAERRAMRSG